MLKSENARLSDWIYVDIRGRDLKSAVDEMQSEVGEQVRLPEGISLTWSGQYEYLSARDRKAENRAAVYPDDYLYPALRHLQSR
jgi:Cu(I)/Ag(I) efflux system membrane protein CusA/SilA